MGLLHGGTHSSATLVEDKRNTTAVVVLNVRGLDKEAAVNSGLIAL